jgi:hypothetical protein
MPTISDPTGEIEVAVDPGLPGGSLRVRRNGRTVVEPSPLGLSAHAELLTQGFEVEDWERAERVERFETVSGKRREHERAATAATVTATTPEGRRVDLDLRVAGDGVAYRYRAPLEETTMVFREASGVRLPADARAWVTPYELNHEGSAHALPATDAEGAYCLPGLFQTGEDWVLVAEAGVDGDYAAAHLRTEAESTLYAYDHPETSVWGRDELVTPWRALVVGKLATVVESDMVPGLDRDPDDDRDFEWVEPGRVAWSWWSESDSPSDRERQREYVDYAAKRGWEYALVDEGWSAEWVPDLVDYAAERGVGIFLWSHWTELQDAGERDERLEQWADWGVAGIKVDFMDYTDQGRMQFYEALLEAAADRELLVNFHGSMVPTGVKRRYPHALTYEGVKGAEHYKWATLAPEHNCTLPFTRNAVGPMDYTPVTFSAENRHTSAGHELALAVVYESGLQHFADGIDEYAARPAAESVLESVPAAWAETRFLGGHPGSEATLARRSEDGSGTGDGDGNGDTWFVGSITAGPARTVTAEPSFLDGERTATVVRDADDGDGLVREERTVEPGELLAVGVESDGGFVARL